MKRVCFFLVFCFHPFLFGQSIPKDFNALWKVKDYKSLVEKLEQFTALYPNHLEAIEQLGDAYGRISEWDRASKCYEKLIRVKPDEANYHYKYGGVLGKMAKESSKFKALGLINQTKKSFTTAAKLDPYHWAVRWAQVQLYVQLPGFLGGSYDKAIAYAEELQSISRLDGYFAKVYIYEQMDEHSLAREYMKKGIKLRQDFSCLNSKHHSEHCKINSNDLRYYLALAYLSEKIELNTAAFLFEKYISDFSSADTVPLELAYFQLANLCLIQDNTQGALTHLNHALELNSDFDLAKNAKKRILITLPD